ncbi:P-type conjugative transfer protein TrbL [Cupriavidus pauculus]|uniref:P-type conjugative transfer protein TrbL n=1 Tax=Cupriavidus pauculus TaxID=82633 RepID=A0A2N5C6N5_9BURK|nr:P-type conjugative transfer protein TrbL [Cupriavidus pauculus]PLP97895.1 P-type conjugative transfer protein TrbL [Cupriavidus pauculus]
MHDLNVIDRFLGTFSTYIDTGFGLLRGEVAYMSGTLVAIDMTLAGLYWALGHATGQGDDVMARLIRKVLYVGTFAYILGNYNWLAGIVFHSFAGLGITATGKISMATFLQPGHLAKTGIDAAAPILKEMTRLSGFPDVFVNLSTIAVLFLAWLIVVASFFVLAVQLLVTMIEYKLTTLAGFVLVPFALWNKTAFLAEKVLGNVISSGIKVLVLAVIVGIGTGLFAEFKTAPVQPSVDDALVIALAALSMLGLGIFGTGVANGLVSGAPQLGAGTMAGAALATGGAVTAAAAAARGIVGAVTAGARLAPAAARAIQTRLMSAASRGMPNSGPAKGAGVSQAASASASGTGAGPAAEGQQPEWAKRLASARQIAQGVTVVANTLRGGDGGGSGSGPSLGDNGAQGK